MAACIFSSYFFVQKIAFSFVKCKKKTFLHKSSANHKNVELHKFIDVGLKSYTDSLFYYNLPNRLYTALKITKYTQEN